MRAPFWSGWARRCLAVASLSLSVAAPGAALVAAEAAVPAERIAAADSLLREALVSEVDGRNEDRAALLAKAEALVPDLPAAKWHRGMVRTNGTWLPAEDVAVSSSDREVVEQYVAKRDAMPDTLEGHSALAWWCRDKGLHAQERAHLTRVLRFAPNHAEVRDRLGYVRMGDEWVDRADIARTIAEEARAQASIDKHGAALFVAARAASDGFPSRRERAAATLRAVRDPEVIPALEAAVSAGGEAACLPALEALASMPEDEASLSLARFAVLSPSAQVREAASLALKEREPGDFVPYLIASMTTPIRAEFQVARRIDDRRIACRQVFYRESMRSADTLVRDTVYIGSEPTGGRIEGAGDDVVSRATISDAVAAATMTSALIQFRNAEAQEINARFGAALETATGMKFGADAQAWWDWWDRYEEVAYDGKQVDVRYELAPAQVPISVLRERQARAGLVVGGPEVTVSPHNCFAAGTPVLTNRGEVPIEQVRVGDLVLSQDVESGELAYKPVLDTTIGPPTEMLRVDHEGGSFRCTGGHPFWVSGEGWINARRLKSGMELHSTRGSVRVSDVASDGAEAAYNLIVADFSTYFVGQARILCHDISPKESTDAIVPGLRQE